MQTPRSTRAGLFVTSEEERNFRGSLRNDSAATASYASPTKTTLARMQKSSFKTSTHTDLDRVKNRNGVLKEKLAETSEAKRIVEASNCEMNKQLTWAHRRCVELEAEVRAGVARLEQANQLNTTLHENLAITHTRLKEEEESGESLTKRVKELEVEKAQMVVAHEQHCKLMEDRFVHVCTEYQKLELQAREISSKNSSLKTKFDLEEHLRREVEARASNLQNQVGILSTQVQVLQSGAKENSAAGSSLESQRQQEVEEIIADLKQKLSERSRRLGEVEEKLMRVERERNHLQAAVGLEVGGANSAAEWHPGDGLDYKTTYVTVSPPQANPLSSDGPFAPPLQAPGAADPRTATGMMFPPFNSFGGVGKPRSSALKGLSDLLANTST